MCYTHWKDSKAITEIGEAGKLKFSLIGINFAKGKTND